MIAVQLTTSDVVNITGNADLTSAPALAELEKHLRKRSNIVLDVAKLEYADTTFLRFLIRLRMRPRDRGPVKVRLVGVRPNLRRILEITGLNKLVVYESL